VLLKEPTSGARHTKDGPLPSDLSLPSASMRRSLLGSMSFVLVSLRALHIDAGCISTRPVAQEGPVGRALNGDSYTGNSDLGGLISDGSLTPFIQARYLYKPGALSPIGNHTAGQICVSPSRR
jgi:hypothetical protein